MLVLNRTQKSYLRGAIWVAALAVAVMLPRVGEAQELSDADKAIKPLDLAYASTYQLTIQIVRRQSNGRHSG